MESPRAESYASSDTGRTRMIDAEARHTDLDGNLNEVTADLTGLVTICCSDCDLDSANYEKCQGELALQCLACREKFYHRFWAIRHINSCASIIKQPKYICELCETTFERIDELRRHFQDCASDCFTSLQLENNNTNSEEELDMFKYFANSSEILRKSVREYGHERFYAHFCVECREPIIDETSVDAVDCDECKVSCLLQCNTCKCLHETYESIIEHLKGSYCGYKMQLAVDPDAQLHEQA